MKTSKIAEIKKIRSYPFEWKTMYAHLVLMENGDEWEVTKQKENWVSVWEELTYELLDWKEWYAKRLKLEKKSTRKGGWNSQSRNYKADFISFAMSYAKDLMCEDISKKQDHPWLLVAYAEEIYDRMCEKFDKLNEQTPVSQPQATQPSTNSDKISDAQVWYAQSLWKSTGLSEEQRKTYIKDKYWVESTKDLTKEQAKEYIDALKDPKFKDTISGSKPKKEIDDDLPF